MKILHLTKYLPSFPGGIERVTSELAEAGRAAGHEVTIAGAALSTINDPPKSWVALPIQFHIGPAPVVLGYFKLARLLDQVDVVHVHLPNPVAELALIVYLLSRRKSQRPTIVPIWHAPIVRWPMLGALWSRTVHRILYSLSRSVLVASPQLAALGSETHRNTDFHVLPFGVTGVSKEPELGSLLDSTPFHIVTVGRLVPYKGFDRLLAALAWLDGDWRLTVVGNGPQKAALQDMACRLGIKGRVRWRSNATDDEKDRLLSQCQLFVLPSQTPAECFGLVVGEAFAHGRPVLTTELSTGLAFLARNGQCGATIPVGSTEALTQALAKLRDDRLSRVRAGRANYDFWKRELSPDVFRARYFGFLGRVARDPAVLPAAQPDAAPAAVP